jgi:hypothetical protein
VAKATPVTKPNTALDMRSNVAAPPLNNTFRLWQKSQMSIF